MLILSDTTLKQLVEQGAIQFDKPLQAKQIQPSSIDLRLSAKGWRVCASFLPGNKPIQECIEELTLERVDASKGILIEPHAVYYFELEEHLQLPADLFGRCNPKSSTGRIDVFVRCITERGQYFDSVPKGYVGKLYLEVSSRSFPVKVREGDVLVQLRLSKDSEILPDIVPLKVNLQHAHFSHNGFINKPLVGWRAKKNTGLIDLSCVNYYDPFDFWDPVFPNERGGIILTPNEFYILSTSDSVVVPLDKAGEMTPFEVSLGEFRVHYAGFFDPGFGIQNPSAAVLEVRTHDVPFLLSHNQPIGELRYYNLDAPCEVAYGTELKSHYQGQNLKLSKFFKAI